MIIVVVVVEDETSVAVTTPGVLVVVTAGEELEAKVSDVAAVVDEDNGLKKFSNQEILLLKRRYDWLQQQINWSQDQIYESTYQTNGASVCLARFHFNLTISLDKCQTKSFEMNTLLLEFSSFVPPTNYFWNLCFYNIGAENQVFQAPVQYLTGGAFISTTYARAHNAMLQQE